MLQWVFYRAEFGVVFAMCSALVAIFTVGVESARTDKGGSYLSAYSIFNPGCVAMAGSLSAEQFESELRHRPMPDLPPTLPHNEVEGVEPPVEPVSTRAERRVQVLEMRRQQRREETKTAAGGAKQQRKKKRLRQQNAGSRVRPGTTDGVGDEIVFSNEEENSISRLAEMGFQRADVIEAFVACDRNDHRTAELLLTQSPLH